MPNALLEAVICFDFRPIYGDVALADRLRAWVHDLTRRHPVFLRHMASNALKAQPGLGRLGGPRRLLAPSPQGLLETDAVRGPLLPLDPDARERLLSTLRTLGLVETRGGRIEARAGTTEAAA